MPADLTSPMIEVADAFVADLNASVAVKEFSADAHGHDNGNGAAISPARFAAVRVYQRDYDLRDLDTLKVDVRCPLIELGEDTRAGGTDAFGIEIALQKRIDKDDRDEIDAMVNLASRIAHRYFVTLTPCQGHPWPGYYPEIVEALGIGHPLQIVGNQFSIFDPAQLAKNRFYSVIALSMTT